MQSKLLLPLAIVTALFLSLFSGCGGGVPQEEYDRVVAQLKTSQEEYEAAAGQLRTSESQIAELQKQTAELQEQTKKLAEQYELVGATPAETAANIVKRYYETHTYSKYDFFVCADMALDVWNMLKAQGINAVIQIGNVEAPARDITEADHAWVLAEIAPGDYLALETTAGHTVSEKDNPLYFKGWFFDNPREYKRYIELRQEYDVRHSLRTQLINKGEETYDEYQKEFDYYQELVDQYNSQYAGQPVSSGSQALEEKIAAQLAVAKEKEVRCQQIDEIVSEQQNKIAGILTEMEGLLTEAK